MSSAQARFTSPDEPLTDQDAVDPQSWNLYGYVRNNPLKFADPTGRDCIYANDYNTNGTVTVTNERGSCSGSGGTYIEGTVDIGSLSVNANSGTLNYAYTPYAAGGGYTFSNLQLPNAGLQALQSAGRIAGPVADPRFIAGFYGASALGGLALYTGGAFAGGGMATLNGAMAAEGGASALTFQVTKAAAKTTIQRMGLPAAQAAAALSAIARATATSTVQILREGQNLVVRISRAGRDGYQVMESIIDQSGGKQVVQKAYNAAGDLVHYDPK